VIEFELKFQVDAQQRAAVEAAVARGRSRRTRLQARYFDTEDGTLASQHIVLRLRKEGEGWVQTAKAPGASALQRYEHNVDIAVERASEVPVPRIERHDGTPVGDLIAKALRKAGHDAADAVLVPLYGTDVWRTTREMRTGDARVELAFDRGELRAGERARPVCELEIELKSGSPQSMLELAGRWRDRYGLWLDTVSKSARGEQLARGETHGAPVKAEPPRLGDDPTGPQVFDAVLNACLAHILPNASEIAAGSVDAEHVHQLRVAIRRLRTALREMAAFAPTIDPTWEPALVEAFRALGRGRDREFLTGTMQPKMEAVGGPSVDGLDALAEAPAPSAVVRAPAFQAVLMSLIESSLPAQDGEAASAEPAQDSPHKSLRARLSKLHRQVARDGRRFEKLEAAEQHRVRKRLKRLRYLGEFIAPLFGPRGAKRYLDELRPAQDALGEHNDAAVAIEAYRQAAERDGRAWFAVGWLAAHQAESAAACHDALRKVADAQPFWKPLKSA
jgi:triphosphatase